MKLEEISVVSQCQTAWRFTGSHKRSVATRTEPPCYVSTRNPVAEQPGAREGSPALGEGPRARARDVKHRLFSHLLDAIEKLSESMGIKGDRKESIL